MNIRKNPAKAPSTDAPPAEETLAMSNSVTEEDIDGFVREALAGKAVPPDTQEDVQELLERLADLDLIRQLAGEAHPLVSIGPFEFLEEIGRGGMGAVYKARHRELGKIQAVKVIHTDMKSNSELLARFRREVRAIGALSHPNIIAAHHADIENGSPYLVMDFVDGDSLSNIQKQLKASGQQFSVASACEAVRQAALGIQYAHEQAITHRDIKPGNLVLDRHGVVRVLDLGLAQLHAPEGDTQVTELTRGDQILGTPDFMSPEQLRSPRSVDTRTDVYSLGATLYVLLTGSTPYPSEQDEGFVAKANRILNAPVPDVRKLRPDVPPQLAKIVSKCLAKDANQRVQTAGELADLLAAWASAEQLSDLQPIAEKLLPPKTTSSVIAKTAAKTTSRRKPPRHVWMTIVASIILLPLLAGILFRLTIPGVGELVIESSDPNMAVVVKQVDGKGLETLTVRKGENEPLELRVGTWQVTIEGRDATEYRISPDRIEIGKNNPTIVRIEPMSAETGPDNAAAIANVPSSSNRSDGSAFVDPAMAKATAVADSRDERERQWTPSDLSRIRPGLVSQPANIDPLIDWQMHVIRYPTGSSQAANPFIQDVDPTGNLATWTLMDHAIVADIDTGRIMQIVQSPIANTAIEAVRFSSSGDMISLLSSYGSQVEIRSRQGKLLHRWEADTQYALGNHLWFPNEQRLLLANASKLTVFDLQGNKLAELSFDRPFAAPPSIGILQARQSVLWMSDGILHEWDTASQESQVLVTSPNWKEGSRGGFKVSPSGNRILTWDSNSQTNIWDSEGKLILGRELSLNTAAWSPDDRYIVDGNLTIYNAENLERVNQLALPPDDVLRGNPFEPHWVREGEITFMCQSYGLTTLAGAVRKFHPSGRQLAAAEWPQPLAPASATFNAQGLLTAVHAANVTDCALSIWNADGTANDYVKLAQSLLVNSTEVCWNARTQQILMRDVNGVGRIFDMQGNEVRTLAGLRIGNPMWSPADDRFAVIRYAEQSGQILLFSDGDEPIWTSPAFVPFIPPPTWSPDGRWLAWVTHEPATDKHRLHVLDVADEAKTVHEFSLIEQGVDRCISISPDSQWLVTIRQDPREPQAR
ncbi:MAG: protein kinase, partial [Planctomycetales bacterium]|nr:protein kinase [Planctomycetales bacterium]